MAEVALRAGVAAVEQVLVRPLEVERLGHRLAHQRIGEHRTARVHRVALHAGRQVVREVVLDHQPACHRGEIIGGRPVLRDVLAAQVDLAGLERFHRHGRIAEILDAHAIEVVGPLAGRPIHGPPVGPARIGDAASEFEVGDAIGAGSDRRIRQRPGEIAAIEEVLRQHRQAAEDQRQFPVLVRLEVEHHAARAFHHDVLHVRHLDAEAWPAMLQQRAIGPGHVLGGDRCAVGELRLRPQFETHPQLVGRQLDDLRDVTVAGRNLVGRRREQALPQMADAGAGAGAAGQDHPGADHAMRRGAAKDERIEAVDTSRSSRA